MQDYKLYREEKNLSNNDLIRAVKVGFPSFTKAQMSFASNPEKHALCLVPEAEALIVSAFGDGAGLAFSGHKAPPKERKPKPNRKKPHRLVVYLDDDLFAAVQTLAAKRGYATMQAFLENVLRREARTAKYEGVPSAAALMEGWVAK